jgi:cysteine-S-conjugate beta-lyase
MISNVLSDEVWAELVMDDVEFTGMGSMIDVVPGLAERLIVMASPSKAFNVAGTDVAFALIADKELRLAFARSGSDKAEITPFGYVALRAAYSSSNECEVWRQTLVKYLESQRAHIDARLTASGASAHISWTYPECSYLMWIDCTQMMDKIPNNASPFTYFEERGVAFSDGAPFGRRECVRLNFATSRELLDEGLDRFIAAMDAL